jgi:chromate transporter
VIVPWAESVASGAYGANVSDTPKPGLLQLAVGHMTIGLTSVGGAAGPIRHVLVKQRKWLSEGELAEFFGISQALPGATAVNLAVIVGDRFAGPLGVVASLLGLIVPSLLLAIGLLQLSMQLAAGNPRYAAAEVAVTAAVAGIFISNGLRLIGLIWNEAPDVRPAWRAARVAIGALGILLVAGLHVFIPLAMIVLLVLSMLIETRLNVSAREGAV